jgi:hypothetical protein
MLLSRRAAAANLFLLRDRAKSLGVSGGCFRHGRLQRKVAGDKVAGGGGGLWTERRDNVGHRLRGIIGGPWMRREIHDELLISGEPRLQQRDWRRCIRWWEPLKMESKAVRGRAGTTAATVMAAPGAGATGGRGGR